MAAFHPPPVRFIERDLSVDLSSILDRFFPKKKILRVTDDTIWVAAAEKIFSRHLHRYDIKAHSLGREPKPELDHIEPIMEALWERDGILAIGSGTVNDVAKYAAAQACKPYIVVASAPSMNGYCSANASLEEGDVKRSYPAKPPAAVVADLTILAAAPRRMARAGLGDTLCRSTVELDMILSHHLLGTPYPKEAFDCLRVNEKKLVANPIKLTEGDPDYLRTLFTALCDAGDWMTKTGSSAIASQGEHMIVHTAELLYENDLKHILHGELVAVASVYYSQLQQKLLLGTPFVKALNPDLAQFQRMFGREIGAQLYPVYLKKMLTAEQVTEINALLQARWPEIKAEMQAVMRSPLTLERTLLQANAPTLPKQVRLDEHQFNSAVTYAHLARDRFTFLDISAMTGRRL